MLFWWQPGEGLRSSVEVSFCLLLGLTESFAKRRYGNTRRPMTNLPGLFINLQ